MGLYALRTDDVSFTAAGAAAAGLGRGAGPAEAGHLLIDACNSAVCEMGAAVAGRIEITDL